MISESRREPLIRTMPLRRARMASEIALLLLWLAVVGIGLWLHPSPALHGTHTQLGLPPCGFYLVFHRPCPTCGLTTSFSAMAHVQLIMAARAHPMGPLLFLIVTGFGAAGAYSLITGRRVLPRNNWPEKLLLASLILTVVVGTIRIFL